MSSVSRVAQDNDHIETCMEKEFNGIMRVVAINKEQSLFTQRLFFCLLVENLNLLCSNLTICPPLVPVAKSLKRQKHDNTYVGYSVPTSLEMPTLCRSPREEVISHQHKW